MLGLKGAPSALLLSIPYFLFMSQKGCNGWLGLITDKLLVFTT
ncbi:hypothetical protein V6Z12_D03G095800 [Gossypium hirsutum]